MFALVLLVSSFSLLSLAPKRAEAISSLDKMFEVIEDLTAEVDSMSGTMTHSRRVCRNAENVLQAERKGRGRRVSGARPYTSNPYDLGPISQCSYPQLALCNFPYGYTVPEMVARALPNYNDILTTLHSTILRVDTTSCANGIVEYFCKYTVVPQCISDTVARYPTNSLQECNKATTSCSSSSFLRDHICPRLSSAVVSGDFSLKQCRVPTVVGCDNSSPSPDWLAGQIEYLHSKASLSRVADSLNLQGLCRDTYFRLACTNPTCQPDGHLMGYKNSSECNTFLNCLSDSKTRRAFSASLQCDDMQSFHNPSACAGKRGPPCNGSKPGSKPGSKSGGSCGTVCIVGIACGVGAVVLIVVVVLVVRKLKKKTPRNLGFLPLKQSGSDTE